ncbi:MAG: hypothetical protein JXA69_02265 [Phycisphaerae bacterium]|nr:hypothetical protein [Phycisphaerae bacterium]
MISESNRRDFLKSLSLAAAGGLALNQSVTGAPTDRPVTSVDPLAPWGEFWRPARPERLSGTTRELARQALAGEHGRALGNAAFALDEGRCQGLSANMRYAQATLLAAEKAPLRILPNERIVGSATLAEGPRHMAPIANVGSVSHTTIGFHRVLKLGYAGLRKQIAERMARGDLDAKGIDFLKSMQLCLDAATLWNRRHLDALSHMAAQASGAERDNYQRVRTALEHVPENPPRTFHEAVQSLWSMFAFQRLMGNWSGIGRIDEMLGPYLHADLEAGRITLDEARELIAHFWIKGCEWCGAPTSFNGSGDAQHYQNIVLAGVNAEGQEVTNEMTYLVLDVVEELRISDYPIAVRLNPRTPERLLRRIAEVQRHGGGIVALYNEDVVIAGLIKMGYTLAEARGFANDGCWETLVPGRTVFSYVPFDMLAILQQTLAAEGNAAIPDYADFESLYEAFSARLAERVAAHHRDADAWAANDHPAPLLSLFVEDCIERARGYYNRGARYSVLALHAGGLPDTANSLLVLKKLIFEDKYLSLTDMVNLLRGNWKDNEPLRRLIQSRFAFYGNDNDESDAMVRRVFTTYTDLMAQTRERNGVLRPAGISTFGREIEWSRGEHRRPATAAGQRSGDMLATNCSPSPGTDTHGPTAVLKSYCTLDFSNTPNGATLELKVHPSTVKGDRGINAMVAMMRSFVRLNGWFVHIDVVDSAMLVDAQRHPEKYPNLPVRVAGWSARFATLHRDWQDMIINRTQQML